VSDNVSDDEIVEGISQINLHVQKAIILINKINLLKPIQPLVFGTWNNWELKEKEAKVLLESMKQQGFQMFQFESMIPIIMKCTHLEDSCINKDMHNGDNMPYLLLIAEGSDKMSIKAAGRQHPTHAVKLETDTLNMKIEKLEGQIVTDYEKNLKTDEVHQNRDKQVNNAKWQIANMKKQQDSINIWGVVVYDASEYIHM
jgi:hypothetical protein